jgi:hypothetical protein
MRESIKTIDLTAEETAISVVGGSHVIVTNRGVSTVYVSAYAGVVANADGVKAIGSGCTDILRDVATYQSIDGNANWCGTIYAVADGSGTIQIDTTNNPNFRLSMKGGDSGDYIIVADSTLSDTSTNAVQNKVIKSALDKINEELANIQPDSQIQPISTDYIDELFD